MHTRAFDAVIHRPRDLEEELQDLVAAKGGVRAELLHTSERVEWSR